MWLMVRVSWTAQRQGLLRALFINSAFLLGRTTAINGSHTIADLEGT